MLIVIDFFGLIKTRLNVMTYYILNLILYFLILAYNIKYSTGRASDTFILYSNFQQNFT